VNNVESHLMGVDEHKQVVLEGSEANGSPRVFKNYYQESELNYHVTL
jgi:hypothetical protein